MKRTFTVICLVLMLPALMFAGGKKETGRDQAVDAAESGQFINTSNIDSENYLFDFKIETEVDPDEPLTINVDLLKDKVWTKGDLVSLRIALQTNNKDFFNKEVSGNFIIYVQNPELYKNNEFCEFLKKVPAKNKLLSFYLYDDSSRTLTAIPNETVAASMINVLKNGSKTYSHLKAFQNMLETVKKNGFTDRSHILWITDENIVERKSDANFFSFTTSIFASDNTTFSYLAYGENPDWSILNSNLVALNGNTFYADDVAEIISKTEEDIDFFSKPAIEDIHVNIVMSRYIYQASNFYPQSEYGIINDFWASISNGTKTEHYMGGMNYGETNRFMHYITVPSYQSLRQNFLTDLESYHDGELTPKDLRIKLCEVYADYYCPFDGQRHYFKKDVFVDYVDDGTMTEDFNRYVYADTIIQNTPFILGEVNKLVSGTNQQCLPAIQLINRQISLLRKVNEIRPDEAVEKDIELLSGYYDMLYKQAKVMSQLY